MKVTAEKIMAVQERMPKLLYLTGAPTNDMAIEAVARAYAKIVHMLPLREVAEIGRRKSPMFAVAARMRSEGIDYPDPEMEPDLKAIVEEHGDLLDIDWLFDQYLDGNDRFPAPVKLREIYTAKLPAWDGRAVGDVVVEE